MAQAGTRLEDLDKGHPGSGDNDLVQQIFDTMNEPSGSNPIFGSSAPPVPMGSRAPMINAQQQMPSTLPMNADPAVPTAHMIGSDHPTAADFQTVMNNGPIPFNSMEPGSSLGQSVHSMNVPSNHTVMEEPRKNWHGKMIDELKQPILVALIVFIITLPALNLLIAHYAPKLLKSSGEFNAIGMSVRALLAGGLFWFFQNVVGPLVSF